MGTSSSIATGLLDGYARGLQINAFRDRERQRSEAASLEIDAGRDDAAKRDRLAAAEEKRISRERDIYDQTGADLPPGESIAVPAARTEPARRQAESGPVAAEPTVQTNPQAEPSRPPNYNPLAPMSAIPPENRRSFIDRRYEAKAKILQDYYSEIDRPDLALAVPGIMSKLRDSEIEEKGRGALLAMATGDPGGVAAFAKVYQLYDDGKAIDPKSGTFDQATQTWKGIRLLDAETGKEVGTRDVTQNQLFALASNLSAADIAKNNIERMQKIADEQRARIAKLSEPFTVKPGEKRMVFDPTTGKQYVMGEGNLQPGYEISGYDVEGNPILVKNSSSGGGKVGKAPPARGDVAMGILSDAYKTKGSEAGPGEFAAAMDIVRRIVTEDSSIPEERAARVAQIVAANPALAKPMIDPKTGLISSVYTDDEGGRFVITKNLGNANKIPVDDKGEPMLSRGDLEDGAERVLGYITSVYGTKVANLYREAAFDGTGVKRAALHKEIAPGVTAALQDDPRWPGMTEEQRSKAIYIATHRATENQLNLIMQYGKPPERPPSAGDKLKAPVAGLGPGVPKSVVDARQRQADAKAAEDKRNDEKRAKDEAQAKANNALRKEIAGFKDSDIYYMTPEEADKFEKKYRPVLSVWQSKKLIDRALGREPGDYFHTPMGF